MLVGEVVTKIRTVGGRLSMGGLRAGSAPAQPRPSHADPRAGAQGDLDLGPASPGDPDRQEGRGRGGGRRDRPVHAGRAPKQLNVPGGMPRWRQNVA
jgi:hypothetical protein